MSERKTLEGVSICGARNLLGDIPENHKIQVCMGGHRKIASEPKVLTTGLHLF
jgi:hypothetical protein